MSRIYDELKKAELTAERTLGESSEASSTQRRSSRLSLTIPIIIKGADADGNPIKENTWTISVSKHGAKLSAFHRLQQNSEITIENPIYGHTAKARVVTIEKGKFQGDPFEISIELLGSPSVWGIKFAPEDWKAESGVARANVPSEGAEHPAIEAPSPGAAHEKAELAPQTPPVESLASKDAEDRNSPLAAAPATRQAVSSAPDAAELPMAALSLQSKLESSHREMSALLEKMQGAGQALRAELEAAQQRMRQLEAETQDSSRREFRKWVEEESGRWTSTWIENSRQHLTQASSEALESFVAQAKTQLENAAQSHLSRLTQEAHERIQQDSDAIWKQIAEKSRGELAEIASSARAEAQKILKGSLEVTVVEQLSSVSDQVTRELATRGATFSATIQETTGHAAKDLQELASKLKESVRAETTNFTDELARRSASSVDEGLHRIEEVSRQKEHALEEETERFQQSLKELSEKARVEHEGIATTRSADTLERSLEETIAKKLAAASEQLSQELASRSSAFSATIQEIAVQAQKDLQERASKLGEAMGEEAEKQIAETLKRVAGTADEGLHRIEEASRQKEHALEEETERFQQSLKELSEKARVELEGITTTRSADALERSLGETVAKKLAAASEQLSQELASRSSAFSATIQEIAVQAQKDLQELASGLKESVKAETANLTNRTDELTRRAASSVDEGLHRIEEASRQKEHALEEETERFQQNLKELSEKARVELEGIATTRCAAGRDTFERSLEETIARQFAAASEQLSQELANRSSAFGATIQEIAVQAQKDLQEQAPKLKEAMGAQAEQQIAETLKRVAAAADEGLRRIEEASRQREDGLEEQTERFNQRLAEASTSAYDGFTHYLEILTASVKREFEKSLQMAEEKAVQAASAHVSRTSEELIESAAGQLRRQMEDALVLAKEELLGVSRGVSDGLKETLGKSVETHLDLLNQEAQTIRSETEKAIENRGKMTQEELRAGQARLVEVVETEYRRRLERVIAESVDHRIREFEDRLANTVEDKVSASSMRLGQEAESVHQRFMNQIGSESERAAKSAVGTVHQVLGAAAVTLREWADQVTQRLEGAMKQSAQASQQEIGKFMEAAFQELHRGAALELKDLRDRLRQAASVMEKAELRTEVAKAEELPVVRVRESAGPSADDLVARMEQEMGKLRAGSAEEMAKALRAKLDDILKPVEHTSRHE